VARYEIADMEKIPTNLHNFDEVMADFTAELKMVKKNDRFPALSTYEYTKIKMKDETDSSFRAEMLSEDCDVSKKNMEASASNTQIKLENPKYEELQAFLFQLLKKHKALSKDLPDCKKQFAIFKASKRAVDGFDPDQVAKGFTACADFNDRVEEVDAEIKAMPCNEDDTELESKMEIVKELASKADSFIGALKFAKGVMTQKKVAE
jgi:hypothetical protein